MQLAPLVSEGVMDLRSRFGPLVLILTMLSPGAFAQSLPPDTSGRGAERSLRNQLGASINNAGLQDTFELTWRWPAGSSPRPLRAGAHQALGLVAVLTPSTSRLGAWVQWAPLSVLAVRAGAEPAIYFGTFHSLQAFRAYDAPFDADTRRLGGGRSAIGLRAHVSPTLQMRIGGVVARTTADIEWWRTNLDGPLYYEPARDTLLATRGGGLVNATSVVMYQHDRSTGGATSGGLLHHVTEVFAAPGNRIQRLGAIGVHEFGARPFGLPHLSVTAMGWRYLDDPSKRGDWGAAAAVTVRSVR